MHNNTCFSTYLYAIGTHRGNQFKSFVIMSRMTYITLGLKQETVLAKTKAVKK